MDFCLSRQIWVTARHVPGVSNIEADFASRNLNNCTEWTLDKMIFQKITQRFYTPMVDLFVSRINKGLSVSRVYHNGCFSAALEPVDNIHTCPDSANTTNPSETSAGPSNRTGDSSNLAKTALVSDLTGVASRFSSTVTDDGVDNLTTLRFTSNSPNVENPPTGCMASVRSRLQTTGLSPEVRKILLASWRTSTQKRYEGPWQLWASWCLQRNKCPFSAAVADVLEFLSEQFNTRNLVYRTVGVYKACISQLHDPVDGQQLGSLSRFMKGIFQLRPPTPRICSTWRVGPVLRYLSSLEQLEELPLTV